MIPGGLMGVSMGHDCLPSKPYRYVRAHGTKKQRETPRVHGRVRTRSLSAQSRDLIHNTSRRPLDHGGYKKLSTLNHLRLVLNAKTCLTTTTTITRCLTTNTTTITTTTTSPGPPPATTTMDARRFELRWRHHQSTVVAAVASLYRDAALVDVTLACEDQRTYQAHKLVLSACSHYFQPPLNNDKGLTFQLCDCSSNCGRSNAEPLGMLAHGRQGTVLNGISPAI
ncbi:BTB/POZ domain [Trinorchestia longiramus]|nr:BTB/POZ domain [Trinorchestia longiramus]